MPTAVETPSREEAAWTYEAHLSDPVGLGHRPLGAHSAGAGSPECGNEVTFYVAVDGDRVSDCGFEVSGCATLTVVGSMICDEMRGADLARAARISAADLDRELGGLTPRKGEALEITLDAACVALGRAAYEAANVTAEPARTLVAMSGGVDSSAVALLSSREGREVFGVTLELWRDKFNDEVKSCCSASAVRAARAQAHSLGIPHFTLDLREEFRSGVVEPFVEGHRSGVTPNPCVTCNGDVRLDAMIDLSERLGAADLATGHYVRKDTDSEGELLRVARDPAKDQSYMLAALKPESVQRLRFPLGEMTKDETREVAREFGLFAADKPDSQDLCFLAGTTREAFLARHGNITDRPGKIVRRDGAVVGAHSGAHRFTVGQRRGIGVGGPEPLYVLEVRPREREVVVGTREELRGQRVRLRAARLYRGSDRVSHIRLRYHSEAIPCAADAAQAGRHRELSVELREPAEAISPGQSACLLDGERVVGVATISA